MSLAFYLNIVMSGLLTGLVYGLAALGLSLIFTVTRIVDFAHGALMAAGIAAAAALATRHGMDPLLAMPMVATGLFCGGFLLYRLLIGRVAAAPDHLRTLAMLGLALILAAGLTLFSGASPSGVTVTGIALPAANSPPPPAAEGLAFGPFLFDRMALRAALMAGIMTALLALFFNLSQTGKAIRACADSPFGARVVGLTLERLRAVTFGLGAAITGSAGCLIAQNAALRSAQPGDLLALGLTVALVGGLGSVEGALLGGMAVGVAEALAGTLLGPALQTLAGYAVLLLVLALRPQGLAGQNE